MRPMNVCGPPPMAGGGGGGGVDGSGYSSWGGALGTPHLPTEYESTRASCVSITSDWTRFFSAPHHCRH